MKRFFYVVGVFVVTFLLMSICLGIALGLQALFLNIFPVPDPYPVLNTFEIVCQYGFLSTLLLIGGIMTVSLGYDFYEGDSSISLTKASEEAMQQWRERRTRANRWILKCFVWGYLFMTLEYLSLYVNHGNPYFMVLGVGTLVLIFVLGFFGHKMEKI